MQKSRIAGSTLLVLLGLSCPGVLAGHHGGQPKQAMFKTKAEAEAAAPGFGCEGSASDGNDVDGVRRAFRGWTHQGPLTDES